ncbi:MAG: AbrB/MazE/SpoVT family DNA-binding domain-containing protein [Candidatus Methanomethyliales bacterium]|nr:AbrB/MazE/SpoVT family DNA-binding domain-containing protein [Candidatus Methanomethylicales archaeon]
MSITRRVGSKGQIVIPKVFREFLGVRPGEEVVMEIVEKELRIRSEVDPEKFMEDFCFSPKKLTRKIDLEKVLGEEVEERFALH